MVDDHKPDSLKDLDERLRRLRKQEERETARPGGAGDSRSGLGFALRLGVELVAALAVGVGIGLLLDRWLGTAPWLMLVFILLGMASGLLNVYRVMMRATQVVGHPREETDDEGQRPEA